jgi:lipopolysaccharide transport system ATP-binding protein
MSSSQVVIRAENLGKLYRIGERERYLALRDVLARALSSPARLFGRKPSASKSDSSQLWAVKDVSFEIRRGDVVGIIGRNGAGKSTLLKILARITKPTRGYAEVHGRMGTLLEVGTGFHPELTGRENVFLSGAILGMRKDEIQRKFDEIVDFSGVEKFIDTPAKHYSSGMYMRLAFAVAAHLEPEILIVDEVLAVGDLEFQRKCLAKMKDVSIGGRTVLFVSHNMAAVQSLCNRAIVLKDGHIFGDYANPLDAIAAYSCSANAPKQVWQRTSEPVPGAPMVFRSMSASLHGDQPHHRLQIVAELESRRRHPPALVAFDILDSTSTAIMQALPSLQPVIHDGEGPQRIEVTIDLPPLIPGTYQVTAWVGPHNTFTFDYVHSVLSFEIVTSPTPGRSFPHTRDHGHLVPRSTLRAVTENTPSLPALKNETKSLQLTAESATHTMTEFSALPN